MRKLLVGAALALGLVTVPGVAWAQTSEEQSAEATFVAKINDLRASQGVPRLEVHPNLVDKARGWAATMAAAGRIWHSNLADGITADWQKLGENVGVGGSVEGLHNAFVGSPKHYENLVDSAFTFVGIGVVTVDRTIYVSESFMQLMPPRAQAPSRPAAVATPPAPKPAPTTTTAPKSAPTTMTAPKRVVPRSAPKPAASPPPKPTTTTSPAPTTITTTAPAPVAIPEPPPAPPPSPAPVSAPVAGPERPAGPTSSPAPALPEPWLLLASVFGRARRVDG
jgi:hypothetical protein